MKRNQFNFRADPDLLGRVRILAMLQGKSMSKFITDAVTTAYDKELAAKPSLKRVINAARKAQR